MKGINHRNSLIPIMNLYSNRKLPLLSIFPTAIAIVSDPCQCSNITTPSMYSRGSEARRSRPYPGAPSSSSHRAGAVAAHPGQRTSTARPVPHVNPKITPQGKARMYEEQRENTYRDRLCPMCSDSSTPIYHQHFSTTDIRRMFIEQYTREKKDMNQQTYMCPICSELEPVLFPSSETRRVVLADSTMYGIWGKKMPSNTPHFDIDSIVGGRVRDMTRALVKNYLHLPNRFEIIVIAGINNIGVGEKAEEVIKEVEELKRVVRDHSLKWKHNPPSYAAVSTVLLAPKFCSLYVPPSPPEPEIARWVPAPGFRNKYCEIKKLNDLIIAANTRDNLKCVRLDFQGVKRFKSGTVQHIFDTKPGATLVWRETEVFRKLHFTMEIKLKLVKYITTCFEANRERVANPSHN